MATRTKNAKEIFVEAIEQYAPSQWPEFLNEACDNDSALRKRVEILLKAHVGDESLLDRPAIAPAPTLEQTTERLGTLIGPYKLLEQIGEGGMGLVYMAEQQQSVRRLVALKLVKPGMDSKQVIARFEAERQALAMMDHPNIAKVFDAGTTEAGRPYFVMELVRGIPLNEFCDQKRLTVRERMQLFIQVCQAVQHAHQKGIIHRDLKPTNVLITMDDTVPFPKVIDFGIAKALGHSLTDSTLHTGYAQLVGTPLYMSPEQAEMNLLGVDTRSDVYSLGVLLYELLTGMTPFDKETLTKAGFDEMRRIIREDDPPRPSARMSTLNAQALSTISQQRNIDARRISATLRGELDWIVMKALEKNRNRRYESASSLAADIQRYLSDEPVLACPPTAMYRFQKFARKHKPAFATAAAIALCLILGTTVSAWQAARATTAEAQANANANQAQEKAQEATTQRDEAQRQRDEVKALADRLQRTLYAAHMNLAHNAWEAGNIGRVDDLLDQHRLKAGKSEQRGFEWHYLYRLCHPELHTLKGHTGFVWSVAYSPDGKRLASASLDNTVKVWDAQTGQELFSLKESAYNVSFSPDSKRLASAGGGGVNVWDAQTGQELLSIKDGGGFVTFSPDGKRLASRSGDKTVKVWDAETGRERLALKDRGSSAAFSPDGKRLATKEKVWDAETGEELLSLQGQAKSVISVTFSPDGKRLAGACYDQPVKVWDAQTGQELMALKGHIGQVNDVAYSPDGKRLASAGGDRTVKVWDAQSGHELFTFKGHTNLVNSVAFSPDGTRLASAALDGTVKIWDATTNPEARTFLPTGWVRSVAFSPDGKRLACGGTNGTWDDTKKAYVNVEVKVIDAQTGQELVALKGHSNRVFSVTFSPDGKRLASASDDKTVKVWNAQTGEELLTCKGHTERVVSVTFSPDGKRLASASDDKTVKVWDAETGQELFAFQGHSNRVNALAFGPDGKRLASSSKDGTVKVWDAKTGQELLSLKGHTAQESSVAFSPDGKRLASSINVGPGGVGEVKVWDTQTGEELLSLKGHTAQVSSVVFSPDGKRLASGSGNPIGGQGGETMVWDAATGQELLTLQGGRYGHRVAFSPNGYRLASDAAGKVTIYDATPLPEKP